jgi:hypothetical protein
MMSSAKGNRPLDAATLERRLRSVRKTWRSLSLAQAKGESVRDPCVYIILCCDTNLEVSYSTAHLFNHEGEIIRTRVANGCHERVPLDELDECLQWGADQLNDFFTDLYGAPAT